MLCEQAGRLVLVARLDGFQERSMLLRDVAEGSKHELVEAPERAQRGDVSVEDLEDAGVATLLTQAVMEREIGPRDRRRIARGDGGVDLVDQHAKTGERRGVTSARKQARGTSLEGGTQPVDLADVVGGEAHDERAPPRFFLQKPFGSEEFERFAHGASAD